MKKKYLLVALIASVLYSCNDSKFMIDGRIACHPNCKIYLDLITPGQQEVIDSTKLDDNGNFTFTVATLDDNPAWYNLRLHQAGEIIPLILKSGDRVNVNSIGNINRNYIVEGSEDSRLMKNISSILSNGAQTLDSIANLYIGAHDAVVKNALHQEYLKRYYAIKKDHIKFIVKNAKSIVSIYALYQRLPNEETLLNRDSDILYYKMIADSTKTRYPNSPYVRSIQRIVTEYNDNLNLANQIQDEFDNPSNYPEIELPDMYGTNIRLSESAGKVILVDFWSATSTQSKLINTKLIEQYEEYSKRGFEVYQVSTDTSKSAWINAIQEQKLPWITVCDFLAESSSPIAAYNIKEIPSNYLIDKEGNIVAKNIYGAELEAKLAEIIK